MPPSGFKPNHSAGIASFLTNCLADLIAENKGVRSAPAALDRELSHIEQDLRETKRSPAATAVLELTKDFYTRLRGMLKASHTVEDMEWLGEIAADDISREIEAIQIAETA